MRKNKGFTLIELIITLALVGTIITGATYLVVLGIRGQQNSVSEFEVQSNLRIVTQRMNSTIRDVTALFLLHRDNADNLTDEWDYIMLSEDKNTLLHYAWNSETSTHDLKILFPSIEGVEMSLIFTKGDPDDIDKLINYNLVVSGLGQDRVIETELESKNALQVVDRSYLYEANTLAYRYDTRLDEVSNSQAAVAMVLDKSGSMSNNFGSGDSKMKMLKTEATRLVNELAELSNVHISINPFDSFTKYPEGYNGRMLNAKDERYTSPGLISIINGLVANGATNTGDGIRKAFYQLKSFNDQHTSTTNKNFMIILVDGVSTYASAESQDEGESDILTRYFGWRQFVEHPIPSDGSELEVGGETYTYSHSEYSTFFGIRIGRTDYYVRLVSKPDVVYVVGDRDVNSSDTIGNGSDLDPFGRAYIGLLSTNSFYDDYRTLYDDNYTYEDSIGSLVRSYKVGTNEEIKVYVIGFYNENNPQLETNLEEIALATTGDTVFYTAGSQEALNEIFSSIQRDISDALWHIGGPN